MGRLYVVATPVGNLEDITVRAIKILLSVPVIACEDTRRTGMLIKILKERYSDFLYSHPNPPPKLGGGNQREGVKKYLSVRDWNEAEQVEKVMQLLETDDVALVSDAGTPLLSDPGYKIVREARKRNFEVMSVPGPFAGAAAVSISGLPTNKVMFWGFLPKKWDLEPGLTHVIYESPVRLNKTLKKIEMKYPEAEIVIACELTKIHEKIWKHKNGEDEKVRGEVTVLVNFGRSW